MSEFGLNALPEERRALSTVAWRPFTTLKMPLLNGARQPLRVNETDFVTYFLTIFGRVRFMSSAARANPRVTSNSSTTRAFSRILLATVTT